MPRRVADIVGAACPGARITPATRLQEDLGLGSLAMIELAVRLEDELGIRIPDEAAERFRTVGDIEAFVATCLTRPMPCGRARAASAALTARAVALSSTATASRVGPSLPSIARIATEPRPRRLANISPIRTPSSARGTPMRTPASMSGRIDGRTTVRTVCSAERRMARAVRRWTGRTCSTAFMVTRQMGIRPCMMPNATFAGPPRPNSSSTTG